VPEEWGARDAPTSSGSTWFSWLFSSWGAPTDPLLRYIPEEYVESSQYLGNGISAQDIVEYIRLCGKKATWKENGRDQVRP